jgi:hypothetical protein
VYSKGSFLEKFIFNGVAVWLNLVKPVEHRR